MEKWTPATEGAGFEFTPILKPLEPFRDAVAGVVRAERRSEGGGPHAGASTRFLTAVRRTTIGRRSAGRHLDGSDRRAGAWRTHPAGVARARARRPRLRRLVRRRLQLRLHQHDLLAQPQRRRCRWRTIRARCSSGCSATAAPPTRRRAPPAPRPTAACSTRSPARPPISAAVSAPAIAPSCRNISRRCATSSGASSRPKSRAATEIADRADNRRAFPLASTITPG